MLRPSWLRNVAGFPETPIATAGRGLLITSCVFYILHLLCQGKIALSLNFAFGAVFSLGWALSRRQARFSWHILYFPLALYGLASTVSALAAPRQIHAAAEGMLWFKMLIFPTAVMLFRQVPELRGIALRAYVLFAVGNSIWGLQQLRHVGLGDIARRISGPSSHVMTYSNLLLAVGLFLVIWWWHERRWWQFTAAAIVAVTLLLTLTRSVWLGWLLGLLTVVLLSGPRRLAYIAPLLVVFITFMPLPMFSRLVSTFDVGQESNLDRIRMLQAGGEIIRDYPLLGVGPANIKEVYPLYRKPDAPRFRIPHLHNNVVQIWAERGIVALAAYILLLALFLRECARVWRTGGRMWAEMGVAVTVGLAVAGLFEFNFGDTEVFYILLNLYALLVVSMEQPRRAGANEASPVLVPATA